MLIAYFNCSHCGKPYKSQLSGFPKQEGTEGNREYCGTCLNAIKKALSKIKVSHVSRYVSVRLPITLAEAKKNRTIAFTPLGFHHLKSFKYGSDIYYFDSETGEFYERKFIPVESDDYYKGKPLGSILNEKITIDTTPLPSPESPIFYLQLNNIQNRRK